MSDDHLAATTKIGHSEAQTNDIEKNFPLIRNAERNYEATTREQCKDCRHKYPSTNTTHHYFGFPYSAPEDHIKDELLREMIKANHGKKGNLKLTKEGDKDFDAATRSATWTRQHDEHQNPALENAYREIENQKMDSEEDYSSDEDPILVNPYLYEGLAPTLKGGKLGKAPVYQIPYNFLMPEEQRKERKKWVKKQRKKPKKEKATTQTSDDEMNYESDDEGK